MRRGRNMLLSDKRILELMVEGRVIIEPFERESLGTNSYDVRLGQFYYLPNERQLGRLHANDGPVKTLMLWDERDSAGYWLGPYDALAEEGPSDFAKEYFPPVLDWQHRPGFIFVPAGQTVLAHTIEVVGGRSGVTASMRSRSSIGRSGLCVCRAAGLGDVGYVSRWTLEISNASTSHRLIPVGARVAQMLFYDVGETEAEYAGKYGSRSDWRPEDMVPKLWLDREVREGGIGAFRGYAEEDPGPDGSGG
jgi:dCTP deaminase